MLKRSILFFFLISSCILFAQNDQSQALASLDAYFEKSLQEWQIPGMAIAITSGDEIIFSKGYGYANIDKKQKVDANTLFAVASNSKAFTAAALAQLVDQKKIKWTDKVVDYLPYFKMYDDYVSQQFTIEDLLCHRSGLKTFSGDLLWYGTTKTQEEIITAAQHLTPRFGFRTQFGYSNIMYLAAGKIIETVTGLTWKAYVQNNFVTPLGMNRTILSVKDLDKRNNIATPYFYEGAQNHELEWIDWDNIAPAGAMISSVNDFSKWLLLQINEGTWNEKEYFSGDQFTTMTTPYTNFKVSKGSRKSTPSKHFKAYGLGWSLEDYQGAKVISHGGGYDGMISKSCFVPEKKIGIVVLTNNLNWLPSALVYKTLDVLIGNVSNGKDWSADYLNYKTLSDKGDLQKQTEDLAKLGTLGEPSYALDQYVGNYTDKIYGTVKISIVDGKLYLDMVPTPIFKATLSHWNNDIFSFRFDTKTSSLPAGKLWFDLDKNAAIYQLHIDVPNPDFDFGEFLFVKE